MRKFLFVSSLLLCFVVSHKTLAATVTSPDDGLHLDVPSTSLWQDTSFIVEQEDALLPPPPQVTLASFVYHVTLFDEPTAGSVTVTFPVTDGPIAGTIAYVTPGAAAWTFAATTVTASSLVATLPAQEMSVAVFLRHKPATLASVQARSAAIVDSATGVLVAQYNADQQRPLASLTKVMSALVLLDTHPVWSKAVSYTKSDNRPGAALVIRPGERLTIHDLFGSMLVGSANNATMALVHNSGLSEKEFVRRMNMKAEILGLHNTFFVEPTGLDARNVSTAAEYAQLARVGTRQKTIAKMMTTKVFTFTTLGPRRMTHHMKNSDTLLGTSLAIQGGKTGYTEEAGYSLMIKTSAKVANSLKSFITVVMGSATSRTRFGEAQRLALLAPSL